MGCSKSSSKREVYSNTILPQETKTSNRQPNFTPPGASLVAQMVKHLPAMWETWVRVLAWEDPLEEGMAMDLYPCLEKPLDRGAWLVMVHRVAKSWMTEAT